MAHVLPPPRSQRAAIGLIVAAAFLLVHPYSGIRHDGTLYLGDALSRLTPGGFRDDLYFLFGSQGRFTLLPALYAALISWFGVGAGTIVGLLAAFVLYFAASWYLVSWFAPGRRAAWCVLSVALGWTLYGGNRVFAYSEAFLTARSFAEPAVLLALGALLRGRLVLFAAALLAAFLVHPLIAIGGCLAAWIYLVLGDRRWLLAGAAASVTVLVLGSTTFGPFHDLYTRYDGQWLDLVQEANSQAFVLLWSGHDYGMLVFDVIVLWKAATPETARAGLRRFVIAVVLAGIGATLASLLFVDLIGNPFFGKLQIWRAEWVMHWMAMAVLPLVVLDLWTRGEHGRVAATLLAMGWIAPFSPAPPLLAIGALAIDRGRDRFVVSATTTRIVVAAAAVAALATLVSYESRVFKLGPLLGQTVGQMLAQGIAINVLVLPAAVLLIRGVLRLGRLAPLIALIALAGALALWDQRGPWQRKLESYPLGTQLWPGLIDAEAKVYWYRDLIAPWVLLGHGNYYTLQQSSGAVFSRDMMIELNKRRKVTGILDFQEQICRMMNGLSGKENSCEPDAAAVKTVCTDGAIDYVVLQSSLERTSALAEYATGIAENGFEKKFYLYRCSALDPG